MKSLKIALPFAALMVCSVANAGVSANLGFASDYYFRGIFQAPTSANGGVDYDNGGFYVGTWAADLGPGNGLEVDGYFGYSGEVSDFGYTVGYTGYFYTGDFDDTYQEINLGGSYGIVAVDVAIGEYANFSGPTLDYTYYALTLEKNGFYGKYAGFSQDAEGDYIELGYGTDIAGFDVGGYLLFQDSDLSGTGSSEEAFIFTISKSFDIK